MVSGENTPFYFIYLQATGDDASWTMAHGSVVHTDSCPISEKKNISEESVFIDFRTLFFVFRGINTHAIF